MLFPRRSIQWSLLTTVFLVVLFQAACMLTPTFSHQGRLLDASGNPVPDGTYPIKYEIFQSGTGGTAVYTETDNIQVKDGLFTTSIGLSEPASRIDPTIFDRPTWLQVTFNGQVLTPRQRLQGSPYAFSLASGAVVQGQEKRDRTYNGRANSGSALLIVNTDSSANGGNGLIAINRAAATGGDSDITAAVQALADGSTYGAIVRSTGYRGMYVQGATSYYDAMFDGPLGIWVKGICTGCTMAYAAQNVGDASIRVGDFVAVENVIVDPDIGTPVMQVRRASGPGDAVIGVATGAMTRQPVGDVNGMRTGGFNPTGGAAAAGSYLSVAVQGLVQARAAGTGLQPGANLTAGPDGAEEATGAGFARALSGVDAGGMVWVMLGGQ